MAIQSNGAIVVAATVGNDHLPGTEGFAPTIYEGVIYRLTPAGQLDSTFATGGEFIVASNVIEPSVVAIQADGAIVAAGAIASLYDDNSRPGNEGAVIRLTTAGTLDPTFNRTGVAPIPVSLQAKYGGSIGPIDLAIGADGQIYVASNEVAYPTDNTTSQLALLSRFSTTGTLDTAYQVAAQHALQLGANISTLSALAVQPDGKVVVVGAGNPGIPGIPGPYAQRVRIDVDGRIDTSFLISCQPTAGQGRAEIDDTVVIGTDGKVTVGGSALVGGWDDFFVDRYLSSGAPDPSFGVGGRIASQIAPSFSITGANVLFESASSVKLTAAGKIIPAGTINAYSDTIPGGYNPTPQIVGGTNLGTQAVLAQLLPIATDPFHSIIPIVPISAETPTLPSLTTPNPATAVVGDYDGDGKADIAAELTALGEYVYRPSGGGADVVTPFGPAGTGQAIPAPGDYDGDGKTDIAAYFPAYGVFAYRPSSGGADVIVPFGIAGAGQSIPTPGDYDGDGKTDPAVYLPALGDFAYRPSGGGADVITPFGIAGAGQTIPLASIPAAIPPSASSGPAAPVRAATVDLAAADDISPAAKAKKHANKFLGSSRVHAPRPRSEPPARG